MAVAGFSDGMPFWTVNFEVILWISRSRRTPNYLATAPMRRDIALFIDVGWGDDWQRVEPRLGIFLSNNTALADLSAPQASCLHLGVCGRPPHAVAPAEFLDTECPQDLDAGMNLRIAHCAPRRLSSACRTMPTDGEVRGCA